MAMKTLKRPAWSRVRDLVLNILVWIFTDSSFILLSMGVLAKMNEFWKKKCSTDGSQKPNSAFIYTFVGFFFCLFSRKFMCMQLRVQSFFSCCKCFVKSFFLLNYLRNNSISFPYFAENTQTYETRIHKLYNNILATGWQRCLVSSVICFLFLKE